MNIAISNTSFKFAKSHFAIAAAVALGSLAALPVTAEAAPPEQWASGRILVTTRAGLPAAEFDKIIKTHGGNSSRKLTGGKQEKDGAADSSGPNIYVVEMPPGREQALVQALARNPHVKSAELDGVLKMRQTPADPYYGNEWHLPMVQAPAAWDVATGSGITIAILDTGVEASHPDLAARIVPGWNFYHNNSNTADVYGHGTKVAGVAGAIGNNSAGVAGAAWNAKRPVRLYHIVHGARVANISYGVDDVAAVQNAAQYMRNKGGVVVTAGGNAGAYDASPNTSTMITVAATDGSDLRASWSNYGPYIDVAAPDAGIWTTIKGGGYGADNGTSFASPLTAGVVALMLSANPALQPAQVDSILTSTADDKGTAGRDDYYGYGRINAARAADPPQLLGQRINHRQTDFRQ
eukprot:gene29387-33187_t